MSHILGQSNLRRNSTAERAIDILLLFDDTRPKLTVLDIAENLKISRSTTYRYLQSLRSYGLLEEADGPACFRLGPRVFELERVARQGIGLTEIALSVMQRLAHDLGDTILLTRRFGHQVVCVERVHGSASVRLSYERGQVFPPYAGAPAKVFLAYGGSDPGLRRPDLAERDRVTETTMLESSAFAGELDEIHAHGFATGLDEVHSEVCGVAAPIFDAGHRLVAAISSAGPAFRLTPARIAEVSGAILAAASEISDRLETINH